LIFGTCNVDRHQYKHSLLNTNVFRRAVKKNRYDGSGEAVKTSVDGFGDPSYRDVSIGRSP
jgi:hypothetical protein